MLRSKLFLIFRKYQALKFLCRYIVHYLKKYNFAISDHMRGEFHAFIYLMRENEWKDLLLKHIDKEVSNINGNFINVVEINFSWCNVDLSTEDLPWFLRQNRYRINKVCTGPWYYENLKYYFYNIDDMSKFIKVAKKFKFLMN